MKLKNYQVVILTLAIFGLSQGVFSQDMNYTQYFSTPMYYNPALTGISTGVRARFLFRDQWPSLPMPFKSYYFSADLGDRSLPGSGGLGIMINQDTPGVGLINNFGAALTIGARIRLNSFMVTQIGIKAGIMQRRVNWDDLVFASQLDPRYGNIYVSSFIPPDANKRVVPDFGVGGLVQFLNPDGNVGGTIGLAVDHVFQPDVSFLSTGASPYPRKWVGHADLLIIAGQAGSSSARSPGSDEPLKINLGGIYQNQADLNSLQVGFNLLKFNIYLGAWFKSTMTGTVNNALALVAGYRYQFYEDMNLKFMYSYDLQMSGALQGTGGAHEISMILEFDKVSIFGGGGSSAAPGRGYRPGAIECPTFY
jgi:type IX secretion system PorP/SprF family membrane protein